MSIAALRGDLDELVPLVRRAVALDPTVLVRLRRADDRLMLLVRLPFGVLVGRAVPAGRAMGPVDVTVAASELLGWLDGERADPPVARDAQWRSAVPPARGWTRIDTVPDDVVRGLVRHGAQTLRDAQPRNDVAETLLDSVVLTVSDSGGHSVEVTLRMLSALTRLGFLPRGSHIAVDRAGRWIRVAAEFGSVYAERPGAGLTML